MWTCTISWSQYWLRDPCESSNGRRKFFLVWNLPSEGKGYVYIRLLTLSVCYAFYRIDFTVTWTRSCGCSSSIFVRFVNVTEYLLNGASWCSKKIPYINWIFKSSNESLNSLYRSPHHWKYNFRLLFRNGYWRHHTSLFFD